MIKCRSHKSLSGLGPDLIISNPAKYVPRSLLRNASESKSEPDQTFFKEEEEEEATVGKRRRSSVLQANIHHVDIEPDVCYQTIASVHTENQQREYVLLRADALADVFTLVVK